MYALILRDRRDTETLRERAATGDQAAAVTLAKLLEDRGSLLDAIEILRADVGNAQCRHTLARLLPEDWRRRAAAAYGHRGRARIDRRAS